MEKHTATGVHHQNPFSHPIPPPQPPNSEWTKPKEPQQTETNRRLTTCTVLWCNNFLKYSLQLRIFAQIK